MAEPGFSDVLSWPIIGIHSLLTPDGKVLTFGTDQNGVQGAQLFYDVYDPVTDTHTTLTQTTQTDIFCCVALIIPGTGKILLAGGDARPLGAVNAGVPDVNVYDYEDMSLESSPTGPMEYARWYATMIALPNGQLVALGGRDGNFEYNGYSEIYTENSGWRTLTGAYIEEFENLSNYPRTWVASSGKIITFSADSGAATVYAIDPTGSGSVEAVGQLPFVTAWWQPAIMFDVDRALILADDGTAWIMDITGATPVFTQTDGVGPDRKWSNLVLLPDGKVMLSGGSAVDASNNNQLVDVNYSSAIWDPDTGHWTDADDAAVPRLYHSTALLLPDGTVLSLGGGAPGPVTNLNGEIYTPDYLLDATGAAAVRPIITSAPGELEAGDHFTVTVDNPDSIETLALLAFSTTTHSFDMSARRIELTFTQQPDGTLAVDLPDNVNVLTPGYWMLFAIDANGTPSIASTIHIGVEQAPYMPAVLPLDLGVSLETNGLAAYDGYEDAYVLTPDAQFKAGSVMSEERIDLRQAFSISFEFNVGADDAAADGLAFVLHNDPAGAGALGYSGGDLGALGILNGLGIEFDIYDSSVVYPEPAADHTNVFDTDDLTSDPAVTTPTELANLEDGLWHKVDVVWNGADTLSYTVDGIAVGSWTGDIASTFLAGSPFAYFGFTGATGGAATQQQVRVLSLDGTAEDGTILDADRADVPLAPEIGAHGDASFESLANEYILTPDAQFASGSVMIEQRIDLGQSFGLTFQIHAGDDDTAADGMAFVLHNDPMGAGAIGFSGGALGAIGIANGLGIEFDIYQNAEFATELAGDHTNFFDTDVLGADPAISAAMDLGNIEDGRWHTVTATWNGQELSYTFDGTEIATLDADIATAYLGGSQYAYLGLTGATGGATTEQKVQIVKFDATAEDGTALHFIGPNSAPITQDDTYTLAANGVLTVSATLGVLANDSDPDGDALTIYDTSSLPNADELLVPEHGAVTMNADGSFTYIPDAGFVGTDAFRYVVEDGLVWVEGEVAITVGPAGDPEVVYLANGSATFDTAEQAYVLTPDAPFEAGSVFAEQRVDVGHLFSISFEMFLGDDDLGADGMTFVLQNAVAGVSALGYEGGALGALGIENGLGFEFDTFDSSPYNPFPEPAADHTNLFDTDDLAGDPAVSTPVELANLEDGQWHDVQVAWNGADTLTYSIDGTLVGTWTGDIATTFLGGSSFAYFGFTGATGGGSNTQMVRVTALTATFEDGSVVGGGGTNDAPVASDDSYAVAEDGTLIVATAAGLLANDTDADGDALTAALVAGPLNGTLTLAADGSFVFAPNADFNGDDSFTHRANDGAAESDIVTVSIAVTPVDDAPVITLNDGLPLSVAVQENTGAPVVTITSSDVDSSSLIYSILGGADGALFSIDSLTGALVFATSPDFESPADAGADNIYDVIVQVSDASGGSDSMAISVTVGNVTGSTIAGSNANDTLTGTGEEDTISGLDGVDTLRGLGGNDTLDGGAGTDLLDGGTGADVMRGGTGNDTYVVDSFGDVVTEDAGQGTDAVQTTIAAYTLGLNVENLTFKGIGDFSGLGNILTNTITGGAGNDALDGAGGVDRLTGGLGDDTYKVDSASDVVVEAAAAGSDIVLATSASYTLSNNVENLTFTGTGSFAGTGNGSANTIAGGAEADTLAGGGGADTLLGLAGNDTLSGGGGSDMLDGGSGADSMAGGTGNDVHIVDDAGDSVIENAGEGTDTVQTSLASYTLGVNFENLTFTGSGSFAGTGNASANAITGRAGADMLSGGSGNDRIIGGAGDDTFAGGAGNDTIVFNPGFGNDVITDFGDVSGNNDIIQFSTSVFGDFAAVQQATAQVGADIVITATGSDSLTIKNKTVATLNANDLQFV